MCMSKARGWGDTCSQMPNPQAMQNLLMPNPLVLTRKANATGLGTVGFDGCINYLIWSEF